MKKKWITLQSKRKEPWHRLKRRIYVREENKKNYNGRFMLLDIWYNEIVIILWDERELWKVCLCSFVILCVFGGRFIFLFFIYIWHWHVAKFFLDDLIKYFFVEIIVGMVSFSFNFVFLYFFINVNLMNF